MKRNLHMRTNHKKSSRVAIIGGGLAGIAAASALANLQNRVTLFEARNQLGGRAGSYHDKNSGEEIDNCQHVNMSCCTNLRKLCSDLGLQDSFEIQRELFFISPDCKTTRFKESWLPSPFHLSLSFLTLPYISLKEKIRFARAVRALARTPTESVSGKPFAQWLREHHQSDRLIRRVWEVVLVSALSESLERIDTAYARKVFVDGFLSNREGWRVEIPNQSLDDLYSKHTLNSLNQSGVQVACEHRLQEFKVNESGIYEAVFTNGNRVTADFFILAVPQHQIRKFFPVEFQTHPILKAIDKIETAPITSLHLWFDRKITQLPHAVFVDRIAQWVFSNDWASKENHQDQYRYQVVISASRNLSHMTQAEVTEAVIAELKEVWPDTQSANLIHSRLITEKRAVFSVTPGIDELRPAQQGFLPNLQFAGDWTQTGWPATMEGAVRSGYIAAENIARTQGSSEAILQHGLKISRLSRWLLGIKP